MTAPSFCRPVVRPITRTAAAAALVLAIGAAGCSSGNGNNPRPSESATPLASSSGTATAAVTLQSQYQRVISSVLPSVVEIRTTAGLGSGIVYDDGGHIVTNAHVVGSARSFKVLTSQSAVPLDATLVGTYPADDLAVIAVQGAHHLPKATFGKSKAVRVGDIVLAMGNPLGLSSTVTDGIISAVGRTVSEPQTADSPGATLPEALQTSAAINPGNSGGALVNLDAQVVGIPTLAALSPAGGGGSAPGIGFAIPSDLVTSIADQLISDGKVSHSGRAALGIRSVTVTDAAGQPQGVGVVAVTPSGAAKMSGVQPGDVIVKLANVATPTVQALTAALAGLEPAAKTDVVILRDGSERTISLTLGELGG